MDQVILRLKEKYSGAVKSINRVNETVIEIELNEATSIDEFSQQLKDHLLEIIDDLTILKINIIDSKGKILENFATNQ